MPIPKGLDGAWVDLLRDEFETPYFRHIIESYRAALRRGERIFPPKNLIFNALNLTPPHDVKVVILGQDPYHGSAVINGVEIPQAMGLSFSVPRPLPPPPSLKNIYKEIESDLGIKMPSHGDLSAWAGRGVLLLNSILSVRAGAAGSHKDFGWETFSDRIIAILSGEFSHIVFLLLGNYAKKKEALIDTSKHAIISASHPSPLARGFLGSKVFSRVNEALINFNKTPIDWSL